jgi:hypothetical protein
MSSIVEAKANGRTAAVSAKGSGSMSASVPLGDTVLNPLDQLRTQPPNGARPQAHGLGRLALVLQDPPCRLGNAGYLAALGLAGDAVSAALWGSVDLHSPSSM